MRREITDEQLNELFTRTVKTASPDFATATLTRLKSLDTNEKLDLMLDDLLEDHPVVASQWFTDKTITAIQRQKRVGSGFSAAILRLAAIAAVCTLSAWTLLRPEIERGPTFDYPRYRLPSLRARFHFTPSLHPHCQLQCSSLRQPRSMPPRHSYLTKPVCGLFQFSTICRPRSRGTGTQAH
ncbi:MAG: hypothetical protein LR015_00120 [Verrucomicrobia bacterium]|nr:hypothetical protein [Verrucomicrobiota bacterium]